MQWTVPPPLNAAAAVLVTALVFAAGAYFARTGVRTIGAGMFRNHRTGEVIGGWQARALGYFLLVPGGRRVRGDSRRLPAQRGQSLPRFMMVPARRRRWDWSAGCHGDTLPPCAPRRSDCSQWRTHRGTT